MLMRIDKFKELNIPLCKLSPGTVLISPEGPRYMKCITANGEWVWIDCYGLATSASMDNMRMEMTIQASSFPRLWEIIF